METAADPGQVILDEIAALEVERARIEAQIASRMLDSQELVAQIRGTVDGRTTNSRTVIGITVPVTSLAGLTDDPVTPSTARSLPHPRHHNLKTHNITEPTSHAMRTHAPSPTEHNLATYIVQMQYAA